MINAKTKRLAAVCKGGRKIKTSAKNKIKKQLQIK